MDKEKEITCIVIDIVNAHALDYNAIVDVLMAGLYLFVLKLSLLDQSG